MWAREFEEWVLSVLADIGATQGRIEQKLDMFLASQQETEDYIMAGLDDIEATLSEMTSAEDAVVTLLDTIHGELVAAKGDPAKIQDIIDKMTARKATLAAAVVRDTDAAPPVVTPPSS